MKTCILILLDTDETIKIIDSHSSSSNTTYEGIVVSVDPVTVVRVVHGIQDNMISWDCQWPDSVDPYIRGPYLHRFHVALDAVRLVKAELRLVVQLKDFRSLTLKRSIPQKKGTYVKYFLQLQD